MEIRKNTRIFFLVSMRHGTTIQTGIKYKKISSYIGYISLKYFEDLLNILDFSCVKGVVNLDWFMEISFHRESNHVS